VGPSAICAVMVSVACSARHVPGWAIWSLAACPASLVARPGCFASDHEGSEPRVHVIRTPPGGSTATGDEQVVLDAVRAHGSCSAPVER
jgi:hypothetical protein